MRERAGPVWTRPFFPDEKVGVRLRSSIDLRLDVERGASQRFSFGAKQEPFGRGNRMLQPGRAAVGAVLKLLCQGHL